MNAGRRLFFAGVLLFTFIAHADVIEIDVVPTAWKLENYVGAIGVVVWNTTSNCTTGSLGFPSGASSVDLNRFWATVIAAKVSQ